MTSFIVDTLTICTYVAAAVFAIGSGRHLWSRNDHRALNCFIYFWVLAMISVALEGLS